MSDSIRCAIANISRDAQRKSSTVSGAKIRATISGVVTPRRSHGLLNASAVGRRSLIQRSTTESLTTDLPMLELRSTGSPTRRTLVALSNTDTSSRPAPPRLAPIRRQDERPPPLTPSRRHATATARAVEHAAGAARLRVARAGVMRPWRNHDHVGGSGAGNGESAPAWA
jgi:hypothetical protein